jgi:DNA polymerase III delta prime subunit
MNINIDTNTLFWEKYRPKTINDIILPDRIYDFVRNGIETNLLFFGKPGIGKTTLAKILVQNYPYELITSKLGVDVIRGKVRDFCRQALPFDDPKNEKIRVVYFEEFDRASNEMQEELKSFIEEYSHRVRFIATCNDIDKISEPIKSRFTLIDFNLKLNEKDNIRKKMANKILSLLKMDGIEIPLDVLKKIIVENFPDFRKTWNYIQYYTISKSDKFTNSNDYTTLFERILQNFDTVSDWNYLEENWNDSFDMTFKFLGRDFFDYVRTNHSDKMLHLPEYISLLSDYSDIRLPNATDPFITLVAFVFESKKLFSKK